MKGEFTVKLTIATQHLPNHADLAAITSASKREYAERWGYTFHEQIGNYSELGFDFQRIQIVRDLLAGGADVVFWLGCDTLVMNHTRPATDVMGVLPWEKSLFIAKDVNGLNNDSFIIRNTDWSRRWLDFTLSKEPEYRHDCWMSQRIWQHYVETPEWAGGVQFVPPNMMNSYLYTEYDWAIKTAGNYRKGDFILHLPGMDLTRRMQIFRSPEIQNAVIR